MNPENGWTEFDADLMDDFKEGFSSGEAMKEYTKRISQSVENPFLQKHFDSLMSKVGFDDSKAHLMQKIIEITQTGASQGRTTHDMAAEIFQVCYQAEEEKIEKEESKPE